MEITYLGHAAFVVTSEDTALLMDPWFSKKGAFASAWYQFPRNQHCLGIARAILEEKKNRYIYISHEHEDHFDRDTLSSLSDLRAQIIVPRFKFRDFANQIESCGIRDYKELDDNCDQEVGNFVVRLLIDDGGISRDSAILIRDDETSFLNMNDCKVHSRLKDLKKELGQIDVFACQFSGAVMHPICYSYSSDQMRSISRKKRMRKFGAVRRAITELEPLYYIPSAGPAAFLSPELFHLNLMEDSVFPNQWDIAAFLGKMPDVKAKIPVLDPGTSLDLTGGERHDVLPPMSKEEIRDYLKQYQTDLHQPTEAESSNRDKADIITSLVSEFQKKIDVYHDFKDHLEIGSNIFVRLTDLDVLVKVDFVAERANVVSELDESNYYLHEVDSSNLCPVLFEGMTWSAYSLSFRFKNTRVPDEYNSITESFFTMSSEGFRHGLTHLSNLKKNPARIRRMLPDGQTVCEFDRFCPHHGTDLKNAKIKGDIIECPKHHWRFDLRCGGKTSSSQDSLNAVIIEGK